MCTNLREIENLLSHCPSIRSFHTLGKIYDAVSATTEIRKDPLWHFLSKRQRLLLCRYMRLQRVYNDEGESFPLTHKLSSSKLCVLLRGEVNLACQGHSAAFSGNQGILFGELYVPKNLRALVAAKSKTTRLEISLFRQFVVALNDTALGDKSESKVAARVKKGSLYIVIFSREIKGFIDELCDRLSGLMVLKKLGLRCLRSRYKMKTFPGGYNLMTEGIPSHHIFLLMKGSCLLFRHIGMGSNREEIETQNGEVSVDAYIGSVSSTSFLGFIPYFSTTCKEQPMSVRTASHQVRTTSSYCYDISHHRWGPPLPSSLLDILKFAANKLTDKPLSFS